MSNLKARANKVYKAACDQVRADSQRLTHELVTWVESLSIAEQHVIWRDFIRLGVGERSASTLELCGGTFDWQPGDDSIAEGITVPLDLVERMNSIGARADALDCSLAE